MAELIARSPARGLGPVAIGGVTLTEAPMVPIWSVAPYRGKADACEAALQKALGLPFPAPGQSATSGDATIAWSGQMQAFVIGARPDDRIAAHAALTDQSDAWTRATLTGTDARDVLARWVPIDLSPAAFPVGAARRTLVGHMTALIRRPSEDVFEVLVFRSMAGTLWHEITHAMKAVAARAQL